MTCCRARVKKGAVGRRTLRTQLVSLRHRAVARNYAEGAKLIHNNR